MSQTSMYAPVQLLSASRQNLWRLTLIRLLVLAAQAASVGIALHEACITGRIKPGDLVMLVAFGAGLTWGSIWLRM